MANNRTNEDLVRQLPMPLGQLARSAHNASAPIDCLHHAFNLWEASLRLTTSIALAEYAASPGQDTKSMRPLQDIRQPTLAHWWELLRGVVPVLAKAGDEPFGALRELLFGKERDDLPHATGLDALVCEQLGGNPRAKSTVRLSELFQRLIEFRDREFRDINGRPNADKRHAQAMLAGIVELISRVDMLAGRQLIYVGSVTRDASGQWIVQQYELTGESATPLPPVRFAESKTDELPRPDHVYASRAGRQARSLHPLLMFDPEENDVLFFSSITTGKRIEHFSFGKNRRARCDGHTSQLGPLSFLLQQDLGEDWDGLSASNCGTEQAINTDEGGDFELISRIGIGGMGIVYRAWQPAVRRYVAVKYLSRSGDEKSESRFDREIRALGRVRHHNLVKIYTSGTKHGQWFYSMELVEGADLATIREVLTGSTGQDQVLLQWNAAVDSACDVVRKREQPFDAGDTPESDQKSEVEMGRPNAATSLCDKSKLPYIRAVVDVVRQVALAADRLHEYGIVHRDIKPANIMVTPDGRRAVLMDLGLARLADEEEGRLTRTCQFVGTLRYASPEQVRGTDAPDKSSDIYNLGATLWEMLTLRHLFDADESMPSLQLMERILHHDPQPIRRHQTEVPADLEAIVLKCLEKVPKDRYASAADLADDLDCFLNNRPVSAKRRTWRYVTRKYLGRHRRAVSWGATIVAVQALVLLGFLLFPSKRPTVVDVPDVPRIADVSFEALDFDAERKAGDPWTNGLGMKIRWCPPGQFRMGQYGVAVRLTEGFFLAETELTKGQWRGLMGTEEPWEGHGDPHRGDDYPATFVSWAHAKRFCEKLTFLDRNSRRIPSNCEYRLPTDAEWEYACRAGTDTRFFFGEDESQMAKFACFKENNSGLNPSFFTVGKLQPNPWGLHDVYGNVWEWCLDSIEFGENKNRQSIPWEERSPLPGGDDPVVEHGNFRVMKGGSSPDYPYECSHTYCAGCDPTAQYNNLGFRIALVRSKTHLTAHSQARDRK